MKPPRRILAAGTIAQSMSVYLPANIVQKALGMGRLILFTYLVSREQMGVWGSAVMIFLNAAPLVSLGVNNAVARYVSTYEARGELETFYRQARGFVLLLVVGVTGLCLLGWEGIGGILSRAGLSGELAVLKNSGLRLAIVGNVVLMALYLAQISFLYGLRTYTLAAIMDMAFSVLFTVWGVAWVWVSPGAMSLLLAHLGSLAVILTTFQWLLGLAVQQARRGNLPGGAGSREVPPEPAPAAEGDAVGTTVPLDTAGSPSDASAFARVDWLRIVRYGLAGLIGMLIWQGAQYVSYVMVLHRYREISGGSFWVMMQFGQLPVFVANAAWTVLFSHVARLWEGGDRRAAMFTLETTYKAVALAIMTFTVLLYSSSPWWIRILAPEYRHGFHYLSGLLTFYLTTSNLTLLAIPARLHEKPIAIALGALAGSVANIVLASWWMPDWGEVGAARAAGVGMFFGGGFVMLTYLLLSGTRFDDSTYFMLGTPALLLLPTWAVGAVWAILLPICVFSPWVFNLRQKEVLSAVLRRYLHAVKQWRTRHPSR